MFKRSERRLKNDSFERNMKDRFVAPGLFLIIVLPVLLIAAFSYMKAKQDLTEFTLSRRQTIAYLAAVTLKEKLDHVSAIGISFATRVQFRRLIGEGKWEEAIKILEGVPRDFAFINRVFLSDPNGTLMADRPAFPGVRGKNFASRDWYQGVSRQWKPYVSEAYTRTAEPRYNVVSAAIPIKAEDQKTIGILILQVRLGVLLEWAQNIDVGPSGFVYFVDRKGRVVAHPTFSPDGEMIDFESVPTVQKALRGERGVEIMFSPIEKEERISAYEPVPEYGWGVIAQQPTYTAFKERDESLRRMLFAYSLIALFSAFLAQLMIRYIAQRKQAEEALRESEEESRSIIETASGAFIKMDTGGLIVGWNRRAETTFGWSRSEAVGRLLAETIIPPQYREAHQRGLQRFLDTGEGPAINKQVELRALHRDGREFPVEVTIWPLRVKQVYYFNAFINDVTERKEAEEEMRKLNGQLEAANKELEAFSYSVSHDLRAPLRHINGFVEMLKEHQGASLDEKSQKYMNTIMNSAKKMGSLIDDLLVFSRMAKTEMRIGTVNFNNLIKEVITDLYQELQGRAVNWKIDDLPDAEGDAAMLRQVWANLVGNAVKYTRTRERAEIEIRSRAEGKEQVFFIRDNGVGFDPQYAGKLFGVFQRLHRPDEFEGTGIGLANVRRIVYRHGGRTWAEGGLDQGAAFYFSLPN